MKKLMLIVTLFTLLIFACKKDISKGGGPTHPGDSTGVDTVVNHPPPPPKDTSNIVIPVGFYTYDNAWMQTDEVSILIYKVTNAAAFTLANTDSFPPIPYGEQLDSLHNPHLRCDGLDGNGVGQNGIKKVMLTAGPWAAKVYRGRGAYTTDNAYQGWELFNVTTKPDSCQFVAIGKAW